MSAELQMALFGKVKVTQRKEEKETRKIVQPEGARIPMGAKFVVKFSDDEDEEEKDLFEIEGKEGWSSHKEYKKES